MSAPASVEDYRKLAKRRLPRAVFDYIDGGAGDERGLARNRDALHQILFDPRVLVDVSARDISVPFFDTRLPMPFIVGPTGLNGAARPGGDAMLARAAAKAGIPFVLSTAATTSIEDIARATDGEWWFQLYVMERDFAAELCRRALAVGCRTLVLTVDCQIGGRRERDTRNGFVVPFRMNPRFFAGCAIRPQWALSQLQNGVPKFGNIAIENAGDATSQAVLMQRKLDTSFDWEDLERLRQDWPHRLIVKGVMRADDAARCYAAGADGVVISNHGGRQLEDMPAPIEILPEVLVPKGRMLMVDGGFRSGADVVKALALGANAVMLGRATLFGMAAAGEAGASAVIELIRQDIERTLGLIGCPRGLIVKGVMRADDAARCYAAGADGVVISNHGGRQLEDMPAPIEILPEVVVPNGRMLMVDGGFRSGADVVKALALGANAVMLGRATLFGMAAAGEAGASAVIELIRQDIERTLGLIGCPRAEDLSVEFLRPA